MTHHITIPTSRQITPMPTSAGEWFFTGPLLIFGTPKWGWYERIFDHCVTVTENPTSGRLCRELGMGGSIHCGLAPWSGQWRKVQA
jgi:hypothetical protein